MGNSQSQLKSSKFETALHMSIEQALRSNSTTPHPFFSHLYLEKDLKLIIPDVLSTSSDDSCADKPNSQSPKPGRTDKENNEPTRLPLVVEKVAPSSLMSPRFVSSLPPVAAPHPIVNAPPSLQGVMLNPRLPPSPLGPSYLPEMILLPGQYPPQTSPPPLIHQVLPRQVERRVTCNPGCHPKQVSPSSHRDDSFPEIKPDTEHHGYLMRPLAVEGCQEVEGKFSSEDDGNSSDDVEEKEMLKDPSHSKRHSLTPPSILLSQDSTSQTYSDNAPSTRTNSPKQKEESCGREKPLFGTMGSENQVLKQPPKKRRRFHGVDEDPLRKCTDPAVIAAKRSVPPSVLPPPRFLPPPLSSNAQDCTFVPPNLAKFCGSKVVILDCGGSLPVFHGNVVDIFVSPLFRDSMVPLLQLPTSLASLVHLESNQALNFEANILLLIKYLLQLGSRIPSREEFEHTLLRARQDTKGSSTSSDTQALSIVTPAQLPFLAKLCICASNGLATILLAQNSLAGALSEALKILATLPPGNKCPRYIFIINVSRQRGTTEFCVVVPGSFQARALVEASLSISETLEENNIQVHTAKIHLLSSHFARNSPGYDLDHLLNDISSNLDGKAFVPYNGRHQDKLEKDYTCKMQSQTCKDAKELTYKLHTNQIQTAMKILSQVCAIADRDQQSLDLGRFTKVGLLIVVPPSDVLCQQTLERLYSSNLLVELGLVTTNSRESCQQFVMKLDNSIVSQTKFEDFLISVEHMPQTLFVLVHDQAHLDIFRFPQLQQYQRGGLASQIVNAHSIINSPNVLCLQVSSLPYNLQTNKSRIPKGNEIFMETHQDQDLQDPLVETKYFGISDYKETMSWTNQTPLLQSDETFELIAESLLTRYPELHSMMVRTYLLVRQFTVAFINVVRVGSPLKDTTDVTSRIVQNLINEPLDNQGGYGHMVLLRCTSPHLARLTHERLKDVRNKLGLQYRFEIILTGLDQKMELDGPFLKRLQSWRQTNSSWRPERLEDLEGIACIVIQCDKETCGETMPRSLKVVDLRLVNHGVFDLASLEQELGLACTYVDKRISTEVFTVREGSSDTDKIHDADRVKEREDNSKDMEIDNDKAKTSTSNHHENLTSGHLSHQDLTEIPATVQGISSEESQTEGCADKRVNKHPPLVLLSKSAFSLLKEAQWKPYTEAAILCPCADTKWSTPLRPLLTSDKGTDKSTYFRLWTTPKDHHYDSELSSEKDNNHPRRLLLSGPPQIGKTGSYLHFCRVLYRMLIKLQEVEVNDDEDMLADQITSDIGCLLRKEPRLEILQKMTFYQNLCEGRYKHCSMVWSPDLRRQDFKMWTSSEYQEKKCPTVLQRLTKFSSHNAFHHCDDCQSYMEGSTIQTRVHNVMISDPIFGDLNWQFLIPAVQNYHFVFDQETGNLCSICLPLIGGEQEIKSPLFMVVKNPAQQSLINLHHAMEGTKHVHILICKETDASAVQKQWPCHIVVVLPGVANNMGAGGVKYLVKRVAEYNMIAERRRWQSLGVDPDRVWPFVLLMDDALVTWKEIQVQEDNQCSEVLVSLKTVMKHVESMENITHYGLVGISHWSSHWKVPRTKYPYSRNYVDNMVFLNLQLTSSVQYNPYRFQHEDVDFSWRVNAKNLLICKLSYFLVLVKTSLAKPDLPEPTIHVSSSLQISATSKISAKKFLISPDSERRMLLQAPSQFLLERYLSEVAFEYLLISDIDLLEHPIMVIDEYINLGPYVLEYVVSSSVEPSKEIKDVQFGGLVLNSCLIHIPDADFIRQFHFINGARLLLISPDRNSLRHNVAELDLESKWHFRLLDELQTANVAKDKPVSLLRGVYGVEKDVDKQP